MTYIVVMKPWGLVLLVLCGATGCGTDEPAQSEEVVVEPGEDGPLGKADSATGEVELKVTLRSDQIGLAKQRFGLRNSVASERQVWFYDTPELALFGDGVILRGRSKRKADDDSTVKLRPMTAKDVDSAWLDLDGFKCEEDRSVAKSVWSCSLTVVQDEGELEAVAAGDRLLEKVFSSEQEELLALYAPEPVDLGQLLPLGPVAAQVWKVVPKTFGRSLTMELWTLSESEQLLEVSMRAAPSVADQRLGELVSYLSSRGFDTSTQQETKTKAALEHSAAALAD